MHFKSLFRKWIFRLSGCRTNFNRDKIELATTISSSFRSYHDYTITFTRQARRLPPPQLRSLSSTLALSPKTIYRNICHFYASNHSERHKLSSPSPLRLTSISTNSFSTTIAARIMHEAKLISGKEVSDEIRTRLKEIVATLSVVPKLAIVQVGGREDSNVYIRMKKNFAESVGGTSTHVQLPRTITQAELAEHVQRLNNDDSIHGIIVQLPFDSVEKIDAHYITNLIASNKDVDGLTVINSGNLLHGKLGGSHSYKPCTPNGCLELIRKAGVKIAGARAVVIGRSQIVGSPMAQLLIWNNATVTVCHSKTVNLPEICRQAEILVVAIGQPHFVKKDWIKPGAVVIDCGINSIPDPSKKSGQRLVGDVDFDAAKTVAGHITPVPGGVGPMTVAMLISNTVDAAVRASQKA